MNALLLVAPLFVFALVVVLGFTGCWLPTKGTGRPTPPPPPDPYGDAINNSSPTAWWRLSDSPDYGEATDEIGPPPLGDHYGNYEGNVARGLTPGLIESEPDRAKAQFDGLSNVTVPHDPNHALFSMLSFTVEALVHPDTLADAPRVIVRSYSADSGGWALTTTPSDDPTIDGYLAGFLSDGTAAGGPMVAVALSDLGTAWHLAMTYEKETNMARLYKDGVEVDNGAFAYAANTEEPLQIGFDFEGAIQEVAVYADVVLPAAEIADHYAATQGQ